MVTTQSERQLGRLMRRIEELRAWRNAAEVVISDWTFTDSAGTKTALVFGDFWPSNDFPVTLEAAAVVPVGWAGKPVELELWLGGEGFVRFSTGYQAGLNPMHHRFPVTEAAVGGETIGISVEVVPKGIFGSAIGEPRIERAHLVIPHRETRALERDLTMLHDACVQLRDHEVVPFLLAAADDAVSELADHWPSDTPTALSRYVLGYQSGLGTGVYAVPPKWREDAIDAARPTQPTWSLPEAPLPLQPLSIEAAIGVGSARRRLAARLADIKKSYPPIGSLVLTGHAHIDLAWLWPLAETRRKIRRTFSTVLDLMERYPDFTFNQSSAQAYAWMEADDPAMFARIKQRVAEGRWETVGGMWLEPDCNITGGESMVRHILYGQRYFERTFGVRHSVTWLPDVFGFSGAMPQLLRSGGITGFFTIKLNWNERNRFPYDLFSWEGIDGSRVTANMFSNPGEGYNGNIVPLDTLGTWRNQRSKTVYEKALLAFGWGDGAGGPSERMLENYDRIKDFPSLPKLAMGRIDEFFQGAPSKLPRFVGELYFELHRGTLTSQAKVKELNRAAEHRLLEAEAFATIADLSGFDYPTARLEESWKTLLLNQFHDILPGSSISEVYLDSHRQLAEVVETAEAVRGEALAHIAGATGDGLVVANAGLRPRPLTLFVPEGRDSAYYVSDGDIGDLSQGVEGGVLLHSPTAFVPGLGTLALTPAHGQSPSTSSSVGATPEAHGGFTLTNGLLTVRIGIDGTIHRIFDVAANRDILAARGNQLWGYVDKPRAWDAWDVDEDHERSGFEITDVTLLEIVESGPIRATVLVERHWRSSTFVQRYSLSAGSRRIDITTDIEWHERQQLVKALFPLEIRTHEAVFETMFGAVRRPTHRNHSVDAAQFEGSAHRFMDMSEPGYGVALLNNAKYGHGVQGNVMTISLVRGPLYPDPLADEGHHHFTYSLFPHSGDWTTGGVVDEAFALNSPLVVQPAESPRTASLVRQDGPPLSLGSLKQACDGNGVILRLYEPHGARGTATLTFGRPVERVEEVTILEEPVDETPSVAVTGDTTIELHVRPFQVLTLRITFVPAVDS